MKVPTLKLVIMRVSAIIAVVELAIMMTFAVLPLDTGPYTRAFLDAALLIFLSTPVIYFWVIKPYILAHDQVVDQINKMAYHDPLTQLANRHLLYEYLEKQISSCARYQLYGALLYVDLDGFKVINDTHGHDVGDGILVEVARRLKGFVRTEDIASRVGGDEFVVVLGELYADEKTAKEKALLAAERIREELIRTIDYKGITFNIETSIGLRILTPERSAINVILKEADDAMYRVKREKKSAARAT